MKLSKGENTGQEAWIVDDKGYQGATLVNRQVYGPELSSYNNIMDGNTALETILGLNYYFPGKPSCVVVKHQTPCGMATGETLADALNHAWRGDPISAYGGIIGFNQELDLATVKKLNKRQVDVLVAPKIAPDVLEWLDNHEKKKDKVVCYEVGKLDNEPFIEERAIRGGTICQNQEHPLYKGQTENFENIGILLNEADSCIEEIRGEDVRKYSVGSVTWQQFDEDQLWLMLFAITVGRYSKSNSIVLAYEYAEGEYRSLGTGYGQCNRVEACDHALDRTADRLARDHKKLKLETEIDPYVREILGSEKVVAFSDAFTPKVDVMEKLAKAGVRYFVQPGGSKADEKVISLANELGVAMIFTSARQFKH